MKSTYDSSFAEKISSRLVRDYGNSQAEGATSFVVEEALHWLSSHYLSAYLQSEKTESDSRHYGKILENIARGRLPGDRLDSISRPEARSPSKFEIDLIPGHFYDISGHKKISAEIFNFTLKSWLIALVDQLPVMQCRVLHSLAKILSAMGDEVYAAAAQYQYDNIASQELGYGTIPQICYGCGAFCAIDGFSIFCYCENTGFCAGCLHHLKVGTLPFNICHRKHALILIPPRPQNVKIRSQEHRSMFYIDGDWVTLGTFKSRPEAKYDL